jgi:hypothetical protein
MQLPELSDVPPLAWGLALTPVIGSLLFLSATKPVEPDRDGWIVLKPTIGIWILGIFALLMGAFFAALLVAAAIVRTEDRLDPLFFVLCPPLIALGAIGFLTCAVMRTKFNETGVTYRGILKSISAAWSDVARAEDTALLGPKLITRRGTILFSKYYRGYRQLLAELRLRRIPGADAKSFDRAP